MASSGTVRFNAGVTTQTISVPVLGDTTFEDDETFTVTLSNPSSGAELSATDNAGTGTIVNDDPVSSFASTRGLISDVTLSEGNSGTTAFVFTVALEAACGSSCPVLFNYATANGSATTADNDYISASGILSFVTGETSKTITVSVTGRHQE